MGIENIINLLSLKEQKSL